MHKPRLVNTCVGAWLKNTLTAGYLVGYWVCFGGGIFGIVQTIVRSEAAIIPIWLEHVLSDTANCVQIIPKMKDFSDYTSQSITE